MNDKKLNTDAILFDLDGTLWDSTAGLAQAWQSEVDASYPHMRAPIGDKEAMSVLGMDIDRMGQRLFPMLGADESCKLMQRCIAAERRHLAEHGGVIYPGVAETLAQLAQSYPLAILSNCQAGYIENFLRLSGFDAYFCDHAACGVTGLSKSDNVRLICARHKFTNACLVGDSILDQISARETKIPFIYARYGYGKLDDYDYVIDCPAELLTLF